MAELIASGISIWAGNQGEVAEAAFNWLIPLSCKLEKSAADDYDIKRFVCCVTYVAPSVIALLFVTEWLSEGSILGP